MADALREPGAARQRIVKVKLCLAAVPPGGRQCGAVLCLEFVHLELELRARRFRDRLAQRAKGDVRGEETRQQREGGFDAERDEEDIGDEVSAEHEAPGRAAARAVTVSLVGVRLLVGRADRPGGNRGGRNEPTRGAVSVALFAPPSVRNQELL